MVVSITLIHEYQGDERVFNYINMLSYGTHPYILFYKVKKGKGKSIDDR